MLRLFFQTTTTTEGGLLEQGKDLLQNVDIDGAVETVKANPVLAAILIGIGVITLAIFFWGIAKQAFKAAFIGAVLSAGAWFWYFNIR